MLIWIFIREVRWNLLSIAKPVLTFDVTNKNQLKRTVVPSQSPLEMIEAIKELQRKKVEKKAIALAANYQLFFSVTLLWLLS